MVTITLASLAANANNQICNRKRLNDYDDDNIGLYNYDVKRVLPLVSFEVVNNIISLTIVMLPNSDISILLYS